MKKVLLAAVILLLFAASGFFAYRWRNAESRLNESVAYTDSLLDSLATTVTFPPTTIFRGKDSVYWRRVATSAQVQLRQAEKYLFQQAGLRATVMDHIDIKHLEEQGLTDPTAQLRASLLSRPDLIPFPGVLGGTMRFEESNIVLLSPPHVFATFDDGHIGGNMLLSYEIENGKIEWKRLWAELDE